jgi:hypothetical protein
MTEQAVGKRQGRKHELGVLLHHVYFCPNLMVIALAMVGDRLDFQ